MKGKRKVKTTKWKLEELFKAEATRLLNARSPRSAHRFLDAALKSGADIEPIGRLAGGRQ
jgi:hypothetical protein